MFYNREGEVNLQSAYFPFPVLILRLAHNIEQVCWPEMRWALPLLITGIKKDAWDCSRGGNETGIRGLWRAIWEVSFLIAKARAGFPPNLVFCLGEYKIMRLLLLPRRGSWIALEISLSARGFFLSIADLKKGAKKKAEGTCACSDAFWWAKKTSITYFLGEGSCCSVCVRNTRIMEFTIENLFLWEMREEKQETANNQLWRPLQSMGKGCYEARKTQDVSQLCVERNKSWHCKKKKQKQEQLLEQLGEERPRY